MLGLKDGVFKVKGDNETDVDSTPEETPVDAKSEDLVGDKYNANLIKELLKLRKEKEVEEARQALEEIQGHEAEQRRLQEERDAILVQKAVEAAKLLMEQEVEATKQQDLEAKA